MITAGSSLDIGPFRVQTRLLPHWVPNAGIRVEAGGQVIAYTGDTGPSHRVAELARGADLLLAEASYADQVPEDCRHDLSSGRLQGQQAAAAGAGHLLLTHLLPGTDPAAARAAAATITTARSALPRPAWASTSGRPGLEKPGWKTHAAPSLLSRKPVTATGSAMRPPPRQPCSNPSAC